MPKIVKKTMEMDQDYIDRLRVIFGVRTEKEAVNKAMEMALYHTLGRLPEPETTHRFC